jgi:hypothetical protein
MPALNRQPTMGSNEYVRNSNRSRRHIGPTKYLKGDQTIWWVFNDKGNVHTETGGESIGLEIRAQAFAFLNNAMNSTI